MTIWVLGMLLNWVYSSVVVFRLQCHTHHSCPGHAGFTLSDVWMRPSQTKRAVRKFVNPFATGDSYMRQLFHCLQWYAGSERVKLTFNTCTFEFVLTFCRLCSNIINNFYFFKSHKKFKAYWINFKNLRKMVQCLILTKNIKVLSFMVPGFCTICTIWYYQFSPPWVLPGYIWIFQTANYIWITKIWRYL